jgi:hypothetical protein
MSKHTAGPWRVGKETEYGTFNPTTVQTETGEGIANVFGIPLHTKLEQLDDTSAEGLANAKLIAASPEMLAIIQKLANIAGYGELRTAVSECFREHERDSVRRMFDDAKELAERLR